MEEKSVNVTLNEFFGWVSVKISNYGIIPYKCSKCGQEIKEANVKEKCPNCGYSPSSLLNRLIDIFASFAMLLLTIPGALIIGYFVGVLYRNGDINKTVFYIIELLLLGYIGRTIIVTLNNIFKATQSNSGKKYLLQGRKYLNKCKKGQDLYLQGIFAFSKGIHDFGILFRNDNSIFTPPTYGSSAIELWKKANEENKCQIAQLNSFRDILLGELIFRYLLQETLNDFDDREYSKEINCLCYEDSSVIEVAKIIYSNHPSWSKNGRMLHLIKIFNEKSPKIAQALSSVN
jgi:hypothetical protein